MNAIEQRKESLRALAQHLYDKYGHLNHAMLEPILSAGDYPKEYQNQSAITELNTQMNHIDALQDSLKKVTTMAFDLLKRATALETMVAGPASLICTPNQREVVVVLESIVERLKK